MDLSSEAWACLTEAGGHISYEPGQTILRQGESPTHVLALISGRVKALLTSHDGSVLILGVRGPGEILGEMGVLDNSGRSATVIAVDRCQARTIPADRFLSLVRSLRLEDQLFRHAMARIREGEEWRAEMAALPAGPRLARILLRLAIPGPDGQADVGLDQTELGLAAGFSRSTVAMELALLRKQGIIATSRCRITIADRARLEAMSKSDRGNV